MIRLSFSSTKTSHQKIRNSPRGNLIKSIYRGYRCETHENATLKIGSNVSYFLRWCSHLEFDENKWVVRFDHAARSISMPREVGLPTTRLSIPTDFPLHWFRHARDIHNQLNPGPYFQLYLTTPIQRFLNYFANIAFNKQRVRARLLLKEIFTLHAV